MRVVAVIRNHCKEISRVAVLEPTFPFAGRKVAWSPPACAVTTLRMARSGDALAQGEVQRDAGKARG